MNAEAGGAKILIIDDDRDLGLMLKEFLAPDRFDLDACLNGEDGLAALDGSDYELVILDIMLPGANGLEILRQLRASSDIPVIMLTAKGDDVDRILGLEFGADDYIAKPFNPRELLARIKAILRRSGPATGRQAAISAGPIELDSRSRAVSAGGEAVRLTGTEFELLRCLVESPGQVVSKDSLSRAALGRRYMPYDRSIDTHVSNLRRKLAAAGVTDASIQSQRGVGYCLIVDTGVN